MTTVLLAIGLLLTAWMVTSGVRTGRYGDFYDLHSSAVAWRADEPIYDTAPAYGLPAANLNPPHVTLLLAPLGGLTLPMAAGVAWGGLLLCLALTVSAWARVVTWPWALRALALVSITSGHYWGVRLVNLGWPLALGMTLAWLAMRNGRTSAAGALVGVCAATKVFLLLFLPYWVWKRQWRALGSCLLALALTFAAGLLVEGPSGYVTWQAKLASTQNAWLGGNASIRGAMLRTFQPADPTSFFTPVASVPPTVVLGAWLALAGIVLLAAVWRLQRVSSVDAEWSTVVLTAILLSPLGWCYYWPLAIGPLTACCARQPRSLVVPIGIAFACVPFMAFSIVRFSPAMTVLIGNAYLWATLALWWAASQPDSRLRPAHNP